MESMQKAHKIRLVGLLLAALFLSRFVFGLPIEEDRHPSPADPAQARILPAASALSASALPLLVRILSTTPETDPAGATPMAPAGRNEVRAAAAGRRPVGFSSPARDLRRMLLRGIPLGAHAPPPLV
jgi:hypothetical protein